MIDFFKALWTKSNDYKLTFKSEEGRRVLMDLMKVGNFKASVFGKDERDNAYLSGKRDMLLYILGQIDIDNEELSRMSEEANKQRMKVERYK